MVATTAAAAVVALAAGARAAEPLPAPPTGLAPVGPPPVVATEPLIDLAATAPRVDPDNFRFVFYLHGLAPGQPGGVFLGEATRAGGQWTSALGRSPGETWLAHDVDASALKVSPDQVSGSLKISLRLDAGGTKRRDLVCRVAGKVSPAADQPLFEEDQQVRQFWTVVPQSQGAVWTVEGTYQAAGDGPAAEGRLMGYVAPAPRPGGWNMGRWDGGLCLDFDLGRRRVNWNHVRLAVLDLPQARDLTAYDGLRLVVATDSPRRDVEVTVWLREEDGSWWYVKSAVPLAAAENEAVLLFRDFAEAEWVSPTPHMDEDYVLDTRTVSHVGVGVVNSLGVGPVRFTLRALDVVKGKREAPPPAAVEATGRTLEVNGHALVPPGIFGGYAPYLPQEYRPGCQRDLYAGTYPTVPRQMFARFKGAEDVTDWPAAARVLGGEDAGRPALSRHLAGLLDERTRAALGRLRPDRVKDPDRVPGELVGALNDLLRRDNLYAAEAFAGVALGAETTSLLARRDADGFTDTDRVELNRRLLAAALPGVLAPLPGGAPAELFWINCYGERKETADLLRSPHWRRHLYDFGRQIGASARRAGYQAHIEFWNEPYLNWAERSRVHLQSRLYREDLAVEGGEVAIRRSSTFGPYDVPDWPALVARLKADCRAPAPSPGKALADAMPAAAREAVAGAADGADPPEGLRREILAALNKALRDRAWRRAEPWKTVALPDSLADLRRAREAPDLAGDDLAKVHRAILEAAFPGLLAPDPARGPLEYVPHFRWVRDGAGLKVVDATAFTYWSGRGNGWIYDEMFSFFARGLKDANPDVRAVAGWGFRWNEDHWAAWDLLYKPTIDRGIAWIDAVHEHHYQGDTTAMNGSYEVLEAYAKTRYDKWLYVYNTETNDLLDAPARGRVDTPEKAAAATEYRRMVYNLRDLVYAVLESPDKFHARTMIHWNRSPEATRVAFGLLKNLRGRLVETRSTDPGVWCVASLDGTDPRAMPPDFDGRPELVVVVFNDHRAERTVDVTVRAPAGTAFAGGVLERTTCDRTTLRLDLERRPHDFRGTEAAFRVTLAERSAWKAAVKLDGRLVPSAQVRRRQFFSPDILAAVEPDRPFETRLRLEPAALRTARRAWLRLVVEDVAPGEAAVTVAGRTLRLPWARTADNVNRLVHLPLDPSALAEQVDLRFAVTGGGHAGYRVDMASIVLEEQD